MLHWIRNNVPVRCDKWLHVARVFKTRTLAAKACDLGRVSVNGTAAKPHRPISIGDRVEAEIGDWRRVLVVRALAERPIAKADVQALFDDLSPPRPQPDPLARLMRRAPIQRAAGAGRPTKRDRRRLEQARQGDEPRFE